MTNAIFRWKHGKAGRAMQRSLGGYTRFLVAAVGLGLSGSSCGLELSNPTDRQSPEPAIVTVAPTQVPTTITPTPLSLPPTYTPPPEWTTLHTVDEPWTVANWLVSVLQIEREDTAYRLALADPALAQALTDGAEGLVWVRIGIAEIVPGQLSLDDPAQVLNMGNFEINAVYAGGRVVAARSQAVVGTEIRGVIKLPKGIQPSVLWVRIPAVGGNAPLAAWALKADATFMSVGQRPEPTTLGLDSAAPARVGDTIVNEAWAIEVISVRRTIDPANPTQDSVRLALIARLIHPLAPLSTLRVNSLSTSSPGLILPDPTNYGFGYLYRDSSFLRPDYRVSPGGSQTGTIVFAVPNGQLAGSFALHFEPEDLLPPRYISLDP